jgi:hypothetical protein
MTKVVFLEFKRSPEPFLDCILNGDALERHRSAMLAVGRPVVFAEGAKLLVRPEDVNDEELFGISVELIISEVENCEPSNSFGRGLPPPGLIGPPGGSISEELPKSIFAGFWFRAFRKRSCLGVHSGRR